ncbi:hypothetical protein GLOIN_2v1512038 [Rhizophagus irregularis DAOM 181602=DAOM 197198]|uniref:Uncharacterized protein n=1 Tax=Rhizophagus irregularis (strain DAOM 181602 / DAOM 197198 / MUCL 43194) TaxID=747089 RepID=A0A2P4QTK2_RHIID|nr:hypothetical protein GLOIN_2v1512038 [Rhizophagus irregularis DAOM 181602=DAOM 197198]POG80983.1 hypothetical protein GLOIN_2v1512038 [Rhizophagus irregularis DAOM 181602=DAOM 197198]|eukprot:XP_025187849.1 hypothetical protein GLOIN_2v1512038 [Rhizophagus irregularis DAOM 181602=DAOM 197198]
MSVKNLSSKFSKLARNASIKSFVTSSRVKTIFFDILYYSFMVFFKKILLYFLLDQKLRERVFLSFSCRP